MTVFFDVPENGAPTAVVPGSHRLPEGPEHTFVQAFRGGGILGDGVATSVNASPGEQALLELKDMPNSLRLPLRAGSAVLFDTATWHTAFPNHSTDAAR